MAVNAVQQELVGTEDDGWGGPCFYFDDPDNYRDVCFQGSTDGVFVFVCVVAPHGTIGDLPSPS
jgi:hypothetical protein